MHCPQVHEAVVCPVPADAPAEYHWRCDAPAATASTAHRRGGLMPVIVVANPKGGVGKTTLATNIAGYCAPAAATRVMLGDVDRQQSSRLWLALRPPAAAARSRAGTSIGRHRSSRPPKGTTHVVLDTPAGLHGKRLDDVLRIADTVLVPLQPSLFDIQATHDFVNELREHKRGDEREDRPGRHAGARAHHRQRPAAPVPADADGAGAGLAARHAELRAAGRARPDAVGRGAEPRRARPRTMAAAGGLAAVDDGPTFAHAGRLAARWSARSSPSATG